MFLHLRVVLQIGIVVAHIHELPLWRELIELSSPTHLHLLLLHILACTLDSQARIILSSSSTSHHLGAHWIARLLSYDVTHTGDLWLVMHVPVLIDHATDVAISHRYLL